MKIHKDSCNDLSTEGSKHFEIGSAFSFKVGYRSGSKVPRAYKEVFRSGKTIRTDNNHWLKPVCVTIRTP